jgi:hypothetical protein
MFDPAATLHDTTSCLRVLALSILRECHSLDRYTDFATAKLGCCSVLKHSPITIFVGPKEGFYRESSKERVQSQSVSRQGRDRENDIEIPQGSNHFRPRRCRGYFFYIQGQNRRHI